MFQRPTKNMLPRLVPQAAVGLPKACALKQPDLEPVFGISVFQRALKIASWIFSPTGVRCSGLPSTPKFAISKFRFSAFGVRPIELGVIGYWPPQSKKKIRLTFSNFLDSPTNCSTVLIIIRTDGPTPPIASAFGDTPTARRPTDFRWMSDGRPSDVCQASAGRLPDDVRRPWDFPGTSVGRPTDV